MKLLFKKKKTCQYKAKPLCSLVWYALLGAHYYFWLAMHIFSPYYEMYAQLMFTQEMNYFASEKL